MGTAVINIKVRYGKHLISIIHIIPVLSIIWLKKYLVRLRLCVLSMGDDFEENTSNSCSGYRF